MMTVFIGLDLAWVAHNATGAVVLEAVDKGVFEARHSALLGDDDEILAYVERHRGAGGTVLGIDAPLIAPNGPGTGRAADREVSRMFGRYDAGVYPANREKCARPIGLAARLVERGFSLDPTRVAAGDDVAIEVYPHASTIGLFELDRIVKYKKGRVEDRRRGLNRFQALIHERLPALRGAAIKPFAAEDASSLRGRALKGLEDRLDAVICAATVASYRATPEAWSVVGDVATGYILVPRLARRE